MKYITKGMYIHRGKGINYWPELGGWMVDNDLRVYETLVDARNSVDKCLECCVCISPEQANDEKFIADRHTKDLLDCLNCMGCPAATMY